MKVIRDLPQRDFNELNAAQEYLFGSTPVIGSSTLFMPVIAQIDMPALPRLMSNRAERAALETTLLTRIKAVFNEIVYDIKQAIEQERCAGSYSYKCYTLTDPLPGEYVENSPMTYHEFMQLCS
jgi:hypothetical protein